jgi:type I restriction enzyme R subunit
MSDETEADTRANRISPMLAAAGWGVVPGSRIRREVICPGRIQTGGKRGKSLSCDYVLEFNGHKLAALEAKRAGISHRDGVGQAKDYATRLGTRFAYASNGLRWFQCDMHTGAEDDDLALPFPSPQELWDRTFSDKSAWRDRFGAVPFETDGGKWDPRYYQHKAITAALEAIAKGQDRILLTLATGTGKTSIAFQIAWKLFQAKWSLSGTTERRPRILFLADRNILADQAYNAFSAFSSDAVARIDPDLLRQRGGVPNNASVFFTIFQTFMTGEPEPVYKSYPADFFDFIVVDECHRGGAKDESEWRDILTHFAPAVQMGMTATPKRKTNADTYAYFGEPVYTYALRAGIEDGYLTPFKVRQMASTIDEYVYEAGDEVLAGEIDEEKTYTEGDFGTVIMIRERELSRVREFMGQMDQRQKTLVFCATQDHAALVRDLINQEKTSTDPNYCHRVTADDGKVGEQHLRDFQDNEKTVPTILTTSQKLSTGVDARNVRHIVLMRPIRSMIEFKQIIGRGTRTYDGKDFFTVWDFVKAHEKFEDPDWDGEPLPPPDPKPPRSDPAPKPPGETGGGDEGGDDGEGAEEGKSKKVVVTVKLADGKERRIRYIATTTYWSADGKPISAAEFLQRLFGDLTKIVADEDQLRTIWSDPDTRERFITKLNELGYDESRMEDIRQLVDAPKSDLFDVLAYILYTIAPKTRSERAEQARRGPVVSASGNLKELLEGVLGAYESAGESELGSKKLGQFFISRYGSITEGKDRLGGPAMIKQAFTRLQAGIYKG